MERSITGFVVDDESHWVAELSCGHRQHTRHDPPQSERPWVLTPEGREARIGTSLDCRRCDGAEMPDGYAASDRTQTFTEDTVPRALLRSHSTKPGVWAHICVVSGQLEYHKQSPFDTVELLTPTAPGVVLPEVEHRVALQGPVEFFVEFWRAPEVASGPRDGLSP